MSFSSEIKEELSKLNTLNNIENVIAEFVGYLLSSNIVLTNTKIKYSTENEYNINRFNKLLKTLAIDYKIDIQGKIYTIEFKNNININEIKFNNKTIEINDVDINNKSENYLKSIVRGAYLGAGSLNNPSTKYHLEIILSSQKNAEYISSILDKFNIKTKYLNRKKGNSIYIKDGEQISNLLAFIGSNTSVLKYEEIRVVKETRNNINRLVNCETANLNKTINASIQQIEAIKLIKNKNKFDALPDMLKEVANLRIKNPDSSLIELGNMLSTPVGKSGVNYRLKKLVEIAEELREK